MDFLANLLPVVQIILSILLVVVILLQQSEAGVGGAFGGGGDGGGFHHTRRGFEKTLFNTTIALGILFALASFIALIL
jgi:preprotein translocase subunit SecG